jgi:hypothetical protein
MGAWVIAVGGVVSVALEILDRHGCKGQRSAVLSCPRIRGLSGATVAITAMIWLWDDLVGLSKAMIWRLGAH